MSLVNLQQGTYGQLDYRLLPAGGPVRILFLSLQGFYVAGLTAGSMKG